MKEAKKARQTFIVLLTLGAVLAIASLLLRVLADGDYEIKTIDLIFLIIPLLVVALATGNLGSLELFGLKVNFADLWAAVGRTEIKDRVSVPTPLTEQDELAVQKDLEVLRRSPKEDMQKLPRLISRQLQALEFKLGQGGYVEGVIAKYFEALSDSLRVVVVNDWEGKLFAIYNAPELISALRFREGSRYGDLADLLNSGNEEARSKLAKLPGFVSAANAVTANTLKHEALESMEKINTDILPVVNEKREFVGTVGRSKLTASLILAVTKRLEDR